MKINLYSVFDAVAKVYTPPFQMMNDDVAKRTMQNCVNNPEHNYALNPSDYTLYKLAEFDDNTGEFVQVSEQITNLSNLAVRFEQES